MTDTHIDMKLGAKAAMKSPMATAELTVNVTMTRRYIWIMKLRYIWAIIRAKIKVTSP